MLRVVQDDRWAWLTPDRGGYGIRCRSYGRYAPEPRCGIVTEQRFWPAGQHRGKATSSLGKARVTDCVDAAMDAVQAPAVGCAPDSAFGVAERAGQLTNRDDAVLAIRQVGQVLMA